MLKDLVDLQRRPEYHLAAVTFVEVNGQVPVRVRNRISYSCGTWRNNLLGVAEVTTQSDMPSPPQELLMYVTV